jgi:VanZ family protein
LGWALVIFVLSSIPGTQLPRVDLPQADKLVHALVYAILGVLIFRAANRTWPARARAATAALAITIATLYGISDELHQLFTPNRSADWHDVVADAIGAAAGVLALRAAPWMKTRACFMMGQSKN